ncbi:hypothetical protein CASFOL_016726 [Castilleja foliolosa]|uniref:CCHC-type domain-containing protein n=1 Tax=Castilleja foliolosa TaxID=1961234 RepID=A0ABD3DAB3_9LAMI
MDNIKDLTISNLSNEEIDAINSLHPDPITSNEENTIIAKIISQKTCNMNAFKDAMIKAWKPNKKTTTNLLEDNTMAFVFDDEEDMEKVLNNAWTFRDHQLVISRWPPDQALAEINLDKVTFWIHAIGVPVSYTNLRNAQVIGDELGRFVKSDMRSVAHKWKKSMRIQVEFDIFKPLKSTLAFSCPSRPGLFIEIRYERLVDFCYSCGLIGHKLANCHIPNDGRRGIGEEGGFGPWMKMENSHIRNPKFIGDPCNKLPSGPSAVGKPTYNWPVPTARQPQRPPSFSREINTQILVATQMNVDTTSDLSNPKAHVKVDTPPGFPALKEHMAVVTESLQNPAVTETPIVTFTSDKMEISQRIPLTATDEGLVTAIIPNGPTSTGPGKILDNATGPSKPNLAQSGLIDQNFINQVDKHVTLKRKASSFEICPVIGITNTNPNFDISQFSHGKKIKTAEISPQKSPAYLNPNSELLTPAIDTGDNQVPIKTPRIDLYSISRIADVGAIGY